MNKLSSHGLILKPRPLAALLLFSLLLAVLPAAAQRPGTSLLAVALNAPTLTPVAPPVLSQKQVLAQDSRLDRPISLDVISVPLDEVLQRESLDKSTETMEDGKRFLLTAAPDCANLKLQVRMDNRPLRTLMTALAQMLPGIWTPTPHGYQLAMTKEAATARLEWWRLFLGEREKALAAQRQAVLAAMQTKARRRQADDPEPEPSDHAIEEEVANEQDFFYSLPPALKEQIATNIDDSDFYGMDGIGIGNNGEQSGLISRLSQMSPQTQEKFKAALQNNVSRLAQAPPAYQRYAAQAQKDVLALNASKVYFWFLNGGFSVLATPVNGPPSISTALQLRVPLTRRAPLLLLNQVPLAAAVQEMGASAPDEWKRLAAYQHGRVWPNTLPDLPSEDHTAWHPVISRAAQMDWLGEQGHMEYVCDYYSHGGYSMPDEQRKLPVKRPLAKELDEMAAKRDVSWAKDEDGIYLVRNNRWYRDDNLEVPEPLLRRWFGTLLQARQQEVVKATLKASSQVAPQAAAQATPQVTSQPLKERTAVMKQMWDWAAEVFDALTPWQVRNGLSLFQPEEKDLTTQNDATAAKLYGKLKYQKTQGIAPPGYDDFAEATRTPPFLGPVNMLKRFPRTAHLYGSLDDIGRTALLDGRLPVSALSQAQRVEAAALLPLLPQALQSFPADSVLLRLPCFQRAGDRIVFGDTPLKRLEVLTPPQNTPPPPVLGE